MSRYIDADKIDFNECFVGQSDFARDTREAAQNLIDKQPAAEVEPMRHGVWKYANTKTKVRSTTRQCSNCGRLYKFPVMFPFAYCPNCGAKMDGKED